MRSLGAWVRKRIVEEKCGFDFGGLKPDVGHVSFTWVLPQAVQPML